MPGSRDHRIRAIGITLLRAGRMGVNVRDHHDTALFAHIPKRAEIPPIEAHNTRVQTLWIEVVVEKEFSDPGTTVLAMSEQKRSALPLAVVASLAERR